MIVAVDGPTASGKGTIARALAAHFRLPHLDTGLLYRAVGRQVFLDGGDPDDPADALGACTLPSPQLLLLDEPTAGVDPKARREFWDEIHALAAEGLTVLVSTHYMDEAERCHEIAYIAYGVLLAHGTVDEVVRQAALVTYDVSGPDVNVLLHELQGKPGIDMVAPFGNSLHVSGRDAAALDAISRLESV